MEGSPPLAPLYFEMTDTKAHDNSVKVSQCHLKKSEDGVCEVQRRVKWIVVIVVGLLLFLA